MLKATEGFTLMEILLTIIIMSIISVVLAQILLNGYNTFKTGYANNSLSNQALTGLERMVYDLRNASSLTTIANTSFTFVDQSGTSYTYSVSGNLLQRGSYTLLDSLQSVSFSYFDLNGVATSTPAAVDYVKISLTLLSANIPIALTTLVCLRGTY